MTPPQNFGALPAFHEWVEAVSEATRHEENERAASAKAVFKDVWEAAQTVLDDPDILFDACPVCDTPFPNTAKGSRPAVALHIQTELASLEAYRSASTGLQDAQQRLQLQLHKLKANLSTLEAVLEAASFLDDFKVVKAYAASLAGWNRISPLRTRKSLSLFWRTSENA